MVNWCATLRWELIILGKVDWNVEWLWLWIWRRFSSTQTHSMNSQGWLCVIAGLAAVPFLHPDSMKLPPKVDHSQFYQILKMWITSLNLQRSSLVDALRCRGSWVPFKEQVSLIYTALPSVLDNTDTKIKIWPLPLRTCIQRWDRNSVVEFFLTDLQKDHTRKSGMIETLAGLSSGNRVFWSGAMSDLWG